MPLPPVNAPSLAFSLHLDAAIPAGSVLTPGAVYLALEQEIRTAVPSDGFVVFLRVSPADLIPGNIDIAGAVTPQEGLRWFDLNSGGPHTLKMEMRVEQTVSLPTGGSIQALVILLPRAE